MNLCDRRLPVDWLPDECLYSLISRVHRVSGNAASNYTTRIFFSDAKLGGSPLVTTHLDALVTNAAGDLGSLDELAFNKQVAGYFRIGLSPPERISLLTAMRGGASAKQVRALMRNSLPSFQLRLCPACDENDRNEFGVAYWHLAHQLPCTAICLKHNNLLHTVEVPRSTSWLHRWVLPDQFPTISDSAAPSTRDLTQLADISLALINASSSAYIDMAKVSALWALATPDARMRAGELENQLWALQPIDLRGERAFRCRPADHFGEEIGLLPAVILAMEHDVPSFLRAYEICATGIQTVQKRRVENAQRHAVVSMVDAGRTPSAAARAAGVDVKTAQVWVGQSGGTPDRRPRKLRGQIERTARTLLQRGAEKQLVMRSLGLSEPTINTLLGINPSLREQWQSSRTDAATHAAKTALEKLGQAVPLAGAKVCRILEPAAYAFLYRNDREWLMTFTAGRPKPPKDLHAASKWDEISAAALRALSADAHLLASHDHITGLDLLDSMPQLRSQVAYLSAMPRTCRAWLDFRKGSGSRQIEMF